MSQSINNYSPLTGAINTVLKGLAKAYSDCPEYCLSKCQRAWEKGQLELPCSSDSAYIEKCTKKCRNFQNLSPLRE